MKLITSPLRVSRNVIHGWVFALCHCSNEHVVCLEFRQSIRRLFHPQLVCAENFVRDSQHKNGHQSLNGTCVALCAILAAFVGSSGVRSILAVFASQKYQAVRLIRIGDCSSITSWSFLSLIFLGSIVVIDFFIHVICCILSSHHQRFARRDSIRQNDVQVRMTIVRYQIHCLVSKIDAIIIVIEDDCHATMFQCRSAQERFCARSSRQVWSGSRFVFHCSSSRARTPLFVRSVAVPHCSLPQLRRFVELTIGNCGAKKGGQTCPKHAESIINSCSSVLQPDWSSQFTVCWRFLLSSSENIQSPSSAHPIVFTCDELGCCADVFGVQVSSTCVLLSLSWISVTLDFDFPVPLPLPWDLFVCLYQQSKALCPCFPQFRHAPSNRESVTFAWVAFFSFLASRLALAEIFSAFPFPRDGIDYHWILIVCVSGWSRLEDASAPQVILSRHA